MANDSDDDAGTLFIAEWLSVLGMNRRQLAHKSGVSEPYVSQLANNRKENPSRKKLKSIADALGITVKDLYSAPPPREVIEAMLRISPDLAARLQQRRRAS